MKRSPVAKRTRRPRASRECQKAMRAAGDIAQDAREKIEALAQAHYDKCDACKEIAAANRVRALQDHASEQLQYDCGF